MDNPENDKESRLEILSTFVRLGILVWSGAILTLAYIQLPAYLGIPEQKFDNTFVASIFTGVLSTFGIQTTKGNGKGTLTKDDIEKMIAKQSTKVESTK
jgi:hypothetical protein